MTREELKQAALSLPYEPGVYLMKNAAGTVIYVGKAKKLKNRVSQYFQDTAAHNAKTRKMVSNVDHFETIAAATEFEALVLECSLIKHYMPKYNILLKDDKATPTCASICARTIPSSRWPRASRMTARAISAPTEAAGAHSRSSTPCVRRSACRAAPKNSRAISAGNGPA